MARFVLVHGSGHGAWCWRDLAPALQALGHGVEALDLPGAGEDKTPLAEVSLATYGAAIRARLDPSAPAVLVGHSAGGFAITEAARQGAEGIARLVYLCAYVPAPGQSLVQMRRAAPEQPLTGALEVSPEGTAFRFRDVALLQNLYGDCPPGTAEFAKPRLSWQPLAPQSTPIEAMGAADGLPRSAILCQNDRTIPPAHQRAMAEAAGIAPADIHEIATGHSPFFADPQGLARILDRITRA